VSREVTVKSDLNALDSGRLWKTCWWTVHFLLNRCVSKFFFR